MLILSLLVRPAVDSDAAMMGDNLAVIACLLMVATGVVGGRIGRRIDEPLNDLRTRHVQEIADKHANALSDRRR